MKKFLISLALISTIFSTLCVFATESEINIDEEVLIENLQNTENVYESSEDYTEEDIEKEYQQMLKEMYEESLKKSQNEYNTYEAEEATKAKVIEVGETEYVYDTDYANVYKYKIQNLRVKILEGEHAGEEMEVTYQLSNDSLLNLEMYEAKIDDEIYVDIYSDENSESYAFTNMTAATIGANLERKVEVVVLAIIAIALVCIFGKEKGTISILIAALMVVLTLLICGEQIFLGTSILPLTIILSAIIVVMLCIQKTGLTIDTIWTSLISMLVLFLGVVITFAIDSSLKCAGGTFDAMFLTQCVLNRNISFQDMFVGSIVLILAGILPYIVCDVWKESIKSDDKSLNGLLNASKDVMTGKIEILTIILTVLIMPKLVFLYCSKYYTMNMIMNSEILVTEFVRFFVSLIMISIAIPVTVFIYKYIKNEIDSKKEKDEKKDAISNNEAESNNDTNSKNVDENK